MNLIWDIFLIILLNTLFALSHTFLASRKIKENLAEKIGTRIAFYRLFFNVSSVIFLIFILSLAPKPDVILYDLQFPYDLIIFVLQVLSLLGLLWAGSQIDMKEFLGISQIKRYLDGNYNPQDLDEKSIMVIRGPFKYSRHPIYLFSILFLLFRPTMDLFYIITLLCFILYFYLGSFFEEKKLLTLFGEQYREYQQTVPRLFPTKLFRKPGKI